MTLTPSTPKKKRIFITGASGCIGHYIAESLIQKTGHDLFLLVRKPEKLQFDYQARSGITILEGDLREIGQYNDLLSTVDGAILAATAWGGPREVFDINVVKTIQLIKALDPNVCNQVIYFSTASILGQDNQLLPQAGQLGTDYIRSKYDCYQQLSKLTSAPPISIVFPTLVFGGDENKPYSHLSSGLSEIPKWINLARFFSADGSFHFLHAYDIAQVITHLVDHTLPSDPNESFAFAHHLVLGNPVLSVDEGIAQICQFLQKKIYFRIPLSVALADTLIGILRLIGVKIQMGAWDQFCMRYRHFRYQNPVSPETLGLTTYCSTLSDLLKISSIRSVAQTE
ncbi:MAG: NAD(P)-dependent oxidoreductase [Roseofilum sp. SBFL]|uniref:NAD-dependent epimerase/dehydratase family protein n=1 Tax=unclassified Roseofilum TaxID=2620099 RepID=UPI001B02FCBC|nr:MULTISPECIES: NAD(P)-dependent oxidoreductase [unclassified Roseofilum]MBP0015082.1 NAD(P)-dependent oxidoreductase [Roseofilum sp. SID3]MBP0024286.1 NAD(P)-dependent oxidoreductase [Roseofilum sp. SID2]MBP0036523.1 NAD(P)-dependent oxidoreductase [Roseofilum sp. SID1]MBP0041544.1 NAD(P)-dependent oxidoreductase [Roseofilum sp. SBFL]